VFVAVLLPTGNLLRDGNDTVEAPCFHAGGAAGYIEEVTWDGVTMWSFAALPYSQFLTHHDVEPMPSGNVLLLCWDRKSKEAALAAGRRPELIPDGEVWDTIVLELEPQRQVGGARVVWRWSLWDHLVQDYDASKANFGSVAAQPHLYDINHCPPGGKAAQRNRDLVGPAFADGKGVNPSQLKTFPGKGTTGERDWVHANWLSYNPRRDEVLICFNVPSELVVVDHSLSSDAARGHTGGRGGRGGDILFRFGNPAAHRAGGRTEQELFVPHCAHFVEQGLPGAGHVLVFNNGRAP
jgi:hypothetical protein